MSFEALRLPKLKFFTQPDKSNVTGDAGVLAGIVKFNALINFNLFDGRKHEPHHLEPVFITGLHGGLHVFCNLAF